MTPHDELLNRLNIFIAELVAQIEAERHAHDATELRLEQTVAQLNHEKLARERAEEERDTALRGYEKYELIEQRATTAEVELAKVFEETRDVIAWAKDLLVLLDVEIEILPASEYKIYEESYDKTLAGLQEAIRALKTAAPEYDEDTIKARDRTAAVQVDTSQSNKGVTSSTTPAPAAARIVQRADLPPQPATVLTTTAPYLNDPASCLLSVELDKRAAEIFQRDLESGIAKVVVESPTELQRLMGEKE